MQTEKQTIERKIQLKLQAKETMTEQIRELEYEIKVLDKQICNLQLEAAGK